jgi:hypothetical protein
MSHSATVEKTARELLLAEWRFQTMVWKHSVPWLASGAAATVGFVWLSRLLRRKSAEREAWDSPPVDALSAGELSTPRPELPKSGLTLPDDVEEELAAQDDARRDIGEEPLDLDTANDPENIELSDEAVTVQPQEHLVAAEESYDAVDADDLGTEWLFRATESHPAERALTAEELAERDAADIAAEDAGRRKP